MYQDVLNALLVSLLEKEKNHALFALQEHTKMNLDKEHAKLAQQAHGQLKKAQNLKLTASLYVDMVLTAHLD